MLKMKSNFVIVVVQTILTQVEVRVYYFSFNNLMCPQDL